MTPNAAPGISIGLTDAADSEEFANLSQNYYLNTPLGSASYQEGGGKSAVSIGTPSVGLAAGRQRTSSITGTALVNLAKGLILNSSSSTGNVYKAGDPTALQLPPVQVNASRSGKGPTTMKDKEKDAKKSDSEDKKEEKKEKKDSSGWGAFREPSEGMAASWMELD